MIIPNQIEQLPVTQIGNDAFLNTQIRKVIIPNSVKYLGEQAFYLSQLEKVVFTEGLEEIGCKAFSDCLEFEESDFSVDFKKD